MLDCLERFTYRDLVMRKFLFLAVLSLTGSVLFLQPLSAVNPQRAEELLGEFRAFYPRAEASDGETRAVAFLDERLSELGLQPIKQGFEDFEDGHSFSSIVRARIEGAVDEDLLLLVPIDHQRRRERRQDGSASLALALALAERYSQETPPLNIEFVFLGAEQGPFARHPMGTRHILRDFFPQRPSYALYLDLQTVGGSLEIEHGGDGVVAPSWLVQAALQSAHSTELPFSLPGTLGHIHRAGVGTSNTPISLYLAAELPAIGLFSGGAPVLEADEWFGELIALVDRLAEGTAERVGLQWDRHYVVFAIPGRHIVVPETVHVIVVWVIAAAMLLYGMTYRVRLTRYLRSVRRNLWNLPVLFLLVFGFLALATVLLEQILRLRGFPDLWQFYPLPFFVMKLTLAIFLFSTVFQLAFRLPLSKHGSFYSAAAIVVLMVLVVVTAGISISFSYYFLWALLCAFLFSITRKKALMPLWVAIAPLWFLVAAVVVFSRPELGAIRALLLSPIRGNAILALVILPFLLMLVRIDFLLSPPSPGKALFSLKLLAGVTGVVSAAFIAFVVVINPFENDERQVVEIHEHISVAAEERRVSLHSPAPLPALQLTLGDEVHRIDAAGRRHTLRPAGLPQLVQAELMQQAFLDRIQHRLIVEPDERFDDLTIRLQAPESFLLFDSNFPFRMGPEGRSAEIFVGAAPPIPLEVEYTVPSDIPIAATIEAEWFRLSEPFWLSNGHLTVRPRLSLRQPVPVAE